MARPAQPSPINKQGSPFTQSQVHVFEMLDSTIDVGRDYYPNDEGER